MISMAYRNEDKLYPLLVDQQVVVVSPIVLNFQGGYLHDCHSYDEHFHPSSEGDQASVPLSPYALQEISHHLHEYDDTRIYQYRRVPSFYGNYHHNDVHSVFEGNYHSIASLYSNYHLIALLKEAEHGEKRTPRGNLGRYFGIHKDVSLTYLSPLSLLYHRNDN